MLRIRCVPPVNRIIARQRLAWCFLQMHDSHCDEFSATVYRHKGSKNYISMPLFSTLSTAALFSCAPFLLSPRSFYRRSFFSLPTRKKASLCSEKAQESEETASRRPMCRSAPARSARAGGLSSAWAHLFAPGELFRRIFFTKGLFLCAKNLSAPLCASSFFHIRALFRAHVALLYIFYHLCCPLFHTLYCCKNWEEARAWRHIAHLFSAWLFGLSYQGAQNPLANFSPLSLSTAALWKMLFWARISWSCAHISSSSSNAFAPASASFYQASLPIISFA